MRRGPKGVICSLDRNPARLRLAACAEVADQLVVTAMFDRSWLTRDRPRRRRGRIEPRHSGPECSACPWGRCGYSMLRATGTAMWSAFSPSQPPSHGHQKIAPKPKRRTECRSGTARDAGSGAPPAASRPRLRSCRPSTAPRHRWAHRRPRSRRGAPWSRRTVRR
jgi:hypothetical protein